MNIRGEVIVIKIRIQVCVKCTLYKAIHKEKDNSHRVWTEINDWIGKKMLPTGFFLFRTNKWLIVDLFLVIISRTLVQAYL